MEKIDIKYFEDYYEELATLHKNDKYKEAIALAKEIGKIKL